MLKLSVISKPHLDESNFPRFLHPTPVSSIQPFQSIPSTSVVPPILFHPIAIPMQPTPLRLPEKSTAFFSSPYHPSSSHLSPIPDNSPPNKEASLSSSPSITDSHTPLLPTPGTVEGGSFPFPLRGGRQGFWTRVRVAMGVKGVGKGGAVKRLLWVAVLGGVLLLVYHHQRGVSASVGLAAMLMRYSCYLLTDTMPAQPALEDPMSPHPPNRQAVPTTSLHFSHSDLPTDPQPHQNRQTVGG